MQAATGRVIVGVLWLVILVAVAGAWSAGARAARAAQRPIAAPTEPAAGQRQPISLRDDLADPSRIDLYGNEVEPAVTEYRIDFQGDLYESHSPDTAITELGAPTL